MTDDQVLNMNGKPLSIKIIIVCFLIVMLPVSGIAQKKSKISPSKKIPLPKGHLVPPTYKVGNLSVYYLERDDETFASIQDSIGRDGEGKEFWLAVSIRSKGRKLLKTDKLTCLIYGESKKPILPKNGTLVIKDDNYISEYNYLSYKSSLPDPQPVPIQFWISFEDLSAMATSARVELSVGGTSYLFSKEILLALKDLVTALKD